MYKVRTHYFVSPSVGLGKIFSYEPFEKAVSSIHYPDYAQVTYKEMSREKKGETRSEKKSRDKE